MKNFEEKYNEYIKKLKYEIPYALGNRHNDFQYEFEHNSTQSIHLSDIVGVLWFIGCALGLVILEMIAENNVIPKIIFFVIWVGIGIWLFICIPKYKNAVSDYFFYKYEYRKIIEERIERDRQRDIQNLLDEMFGKDRIKTDDLEIFLEVYEFKLEDINYFYDRCLSEIKYEIFDEKLY